MVMREMVVCMDQIFGTPVMVVPTVHVHPRRAFVNLHDKSPSSGFLQQISDSSLSPSIHVGFVQARSTRALGMVAYEGGDGEASDTRTLTYTCTYIPTGLVGIVG